MQQPELEQIRQAFAPCEVETEDYRPSWNVAPDQRVGILLADEVAGWRLTTATWGWRRPWSRGLLINAQIETAASKPTFAPAWPRHRCLVPAGGFYEWRGGLERQAMLIRPRDDRLLAFAGLLDPEAAEPRLTILTTAADALVSPIHDRMPVMLAGPARQRWVRDRGPVQVESPEDLQAHPVHPRVGSVRANDPALLDPFLTGEQGDLFTP